jgi:hypothetical protein
MFSSGPHIEKSMHTPWSWHGVVTQMSMQEVHFHLIDISGWHVGPGFGDRVKSGFDSVEEKSLFVANFVEVFHDFIELKSFGSVEFKGVTW